MGFQVKKEDHQNKTFRFPKSLIAKMDKVCDAKLISMNKLVIQCIQYALDHLDEDESKPVRK